MVRIVLNERDLEKIVVRAKDGDEKAIQFLIDKFRPLILKVARQHRVPNYEFEDVVQYGYLTLIKAIKMYKAGNNSFDEYAIKAIRNNIMDLFKRQIKIYNELPNNINNLNICLDNKLSIEDHIIAGKEMRNIYS